MAYVRKNIAYFTQSEWNLLGIVAKQKHKTRYQVFLGALKRVFKDYPECGRIVPERK